MEKMEKEIVKYSKNPSRRERITLVAADAFFFAILPFILIIVISTVAAISKTFGTFFTPAYNPPFVLVVWGLAATLWANHRFVSTKRNWLSLSAADIISIVTFALLTFVTLYRIAEHEYGFLRSSIIIAVLVGVLTFILLFGLPLWQPLRQKWIEQLESIALGKEWRDRTAKVWLSFWTRFASSDVAAVFIAYTGFLLAFPSTDLKYAYLILTALLISVFYLNKLMRSADQDASVPLPHVARGLRVAHYNLLADAGMLDDEQVELMQGVLKIANPQGPVHADAVCRLVGALSGGLPHGWMLRVQLPLVAGDHSELKPDVAVVPDRDYGHHQHPSAALLVIEVSRSSRVVDLDIKPEIYAAGGVAEYWVLDLLSRSLHAHHHPGPHGYSQVVEHKDGSITTAGEPSLSIDVEQVIPKRWGRGRSARHEHVGSVRGAVSDAAR